MKKVLFVCTGNICRSPTAEGVFMKMVREAGLENEIHIDSAGTHGYHIGANPDSRSISHAAKRGYDLSSLVGRQLTAKDFSEFDHILVMDDMNHHHVKSICPSHSADKVEFFLNYSEKYYGQQVPDPYQGGARGFDQVLDMIEDGCRGLLDFLRAR